MRIALILPGFSAAPDDWAIPALQHLAVRLAAEHDLVIFSLRYPAAGQSAWGGFSHHAIGGGKRFGLASLSIIWRAIQAVWRQHRAAPFDVIHAFWADEPGLTAAVAGRLLRRPVIISFGGGECLYLDDIDYGTQGSAPRRWAIRLATRSADILTAGSRYQLALAGGVSDAEKQRQIPLGIDINKFQPGETPDLSRPVVIQAASLTPVKGGDLLLDTMAALSRQLPDAQLLIAGDGPDAKGLRRLAEEKGLSGRVRWLGMVPHPKMAAIYQQAHLYLQSSRHESQGLALLEAMACGLPAMGTPVGILPELSKAAISWQAPEIAAAAATLLGDAAVYARARQDAREVVENHYTLDASYRRFVALYEEIR